MSTFSQEFTRPFEAETALAAYRFVKGGTAENQVVPATTGTNKVRGVTLDRADASDGVSIQILGTALIEASAAIAIDAEVVSTADGKAVATTTSGDSVRGIALQAATASGDIIEIQLVNYQKN